VPPLQFQVVDKRYESNDLLFNLLKVNNIEPTIKHICTVCSFVESADELEILTLFQHLSQVDRLQ